MKKQYINPTMKVVKMKTRSKLLSGSTGLTTGSKLGEEYYEEDVSY